VEKRSGERNEQSRFQVQNRAGWRQVVCGLCYTRSDKKICGSLSLKKLTSLVCTIGKLFMLVHVMTGSNNGT